MARRNDRDETAPGSAEGSGGIRPAPPPGRRIAVHFDTDAIQHIIADPGWAQRYGQDIFRKLAEDPKATLQKLGLPVRDGVEYRVLSNTMNSMNIVIPRKPSRHECSVQHLR